MDADPASHWFLAAPDGSENFGALPTHGNKPAGAIKLRTGDGRSGLLHIEQRHGREIQSAGYASAEDFVYHVAQHYTALYAHANSNNGAVDVVVDEAGRGRLIVTLETGQGEPFYEVRSASVIRRDLYRKREPLWSRAPGPVRRLPSRPPSEPWGLQSGYA